MKHRYAIIRDTDPQVFVGQVNAAMQDGWKPVGGVAISYEPPDTEKIPSVPGKSVYCQAMVIVGVNGVELVH